jgi:hypothetical protein
LRGYGLPWDVYFPAADRVQTDEMYNSVRPLLLNFPFPLSKQVIFFSAEKATANQQWRHFS